MTRGLVQLGVLGLLEGELVRFTVALLEGFEGAGVLLALAPDRELGFGLNGGLAGRGVGGLELALDLFEALVAGQKSAHVELAGRLKRGLGSMPIRDRPSEIMDAFVGTAQGILGDGKVGTRRLLRERAGPGNTLQSEPERALHP